MSKTALVTGAAGFIASHLVEHLLSKDYHVIGVDNLRTGNMNNLDGILQNSSFEFINQDICGEDCVGLHSVIDTDLDVTFHLAAISSVKLSTEDPVLVNRVNVSGTVNVLDLSRLCNNQRVVFTSSAAVYGNPNEIPTPEDTPLNPLSPYAASKIAGEKYMTAFAHSYEMETTILRLFNIYGPRQAYSEYSGVVSIFINQVLRGEPITIDGDGEQTRSFVFVEDVARALILASEEKTAASKIINLSGRTPISINSIAEQIRSVSELDIAIEKHPPRLGDIRDSLGTCDVAERILRFTPEVSFEEGIRRTFDWYRTHFRSRSETD